MRWLSKSHCDWSWIYIKVADVCNVHKTFLHLWGSIHTLNWLVTKPLIWNLTKETLCGSRSRANAGGIRWGKLRQKQRHTKDVAAIDLTGTSHWQTTETVTSHDILKPGVKSVKLVATKELKPSPRGESSHSRPGETCFIRLNYLLVAALHHWNEMDSWSGCRVENGWLPETFNLPLSSLHPCRRDSASPPTRVTHRTSPQLPSPPSCI